MMRCASICRIHEQRGRRILNAIIRLYCKGMIAALASKQSIGPFNDFECPATLCCLLLLLGNDSIAYWPLSEGDAESQLILCAAPYFSESIFTRSCTLVHLFTKQPSFAGLESRATAPAPESQRWKVCRQGRWFVYYVFGNTYIITCHSLISKHYQSIDIMESSAKHCCS